MRTECTEPKEGRAGRKVGKREQKNGISEASPGDKFARRGFARCSSTVYKGKVESLAKHDVELGT